MKKQREKAWSRQLLSKDAAGFKTEDGEERSERYWAAKGLKGARTWRRGKCLGHITRSEVDEKRPTQSFIRRLPIRGRSTDGREGFFNSASVQSRGGTAALGKKGCR